MCVCVCVCKSCFVVGLSYIAKCMKSLARKERQEELKNGNPKESLGFMAKDSSCHNLSCSAYYVSGMTRLLP